MNNRLKTLTLKKEAIITLVLLIGIASVAPLFKNQFVTGIMVNAALIIGVALMGAREGILIGFMSSSIALITGLLPPVLAPMIPFIILGNIVLALTFNWLKNTNYWLGIVAGSILKFAVLSVISSVLAGLLFNQQLVAKFAIMMSWPQLVTALGGGLAAYGVIKFLKRA